MIGLRQSDRWLDATPQNGARISDGPAQPCALTVGTVGPARTTSQKRMVATSPLTETNFSHVGTLKMSKDISRRRMVTGLRLKARAKSSSKRGCRFHGQVRFADIYQTSMSPGCHSGR